MNFCNETIGKVTT